ncbi:MAG: DUF2207 domain-containing protein [Acidimicrobiales bacterium]
MKPAQRRRLDRFWILLFGATLGLVAVGAAFAGDTERIGAYWAHAHIDADGRAQVTEVIDYDFGSNPRHGLLRQIPDVRPSTPFTVDSPTAPDQFEVLAWWLGSEIRVGDPYSTISNRHRYTLGYPHGGLVTGQGLGWNAVGDGWSVPIGDVEIHVTSDRELNDVRCDTGVAGDTGGCAAEVVGPGHLVVRHDKLEAARFLTVWATLGDPVAPAAVTPPTGPAPDPGAGWKAPGLIAALTLLLGAAVTSPLIRRAGREWVWDGGTVDAAFGPDQPAAATTRLVDHDELQSMTTIEFEPPRDLSAAMGGVIHLERVHDDHKTAWLLEAAIREEIVLDSDDDDPSISRGTAEPNHAVGQILDSMFGGDSVISLEKYNPSFAGGWTTLGSELDKWRESSGLWDERGRRRRVQSILVGILALVAGTAMVAIGSAMSNRTGEAWYPLIAVGGAVTGLGVAGLVRSWELRVRTAEGSGAWIRIESFRRFLHDSEAEHVERAADMGLLRQYTAWAVALGEVDRWEKAVEAAAAVPGSSISGYHDMHFVAAAPAIAHAVSTASTAPSSSGGGGGGGAGGGGGGGGGGSW